MNKYLTAVVLVVLVGLGYSQRGEAGPCSAATTYAQLQALGSCDIGDKTFSNFSYTATQAGGAVPVPASSVNVTSLGSPFWGFSLVFPLAAGTGQTNDILIDYTITCNGNGGPFNCIDSNELTMVGGATGTGTAIATEVVCLGGTTIVGCPAANLFSLNVASIGPLSANKTFAPVHMESLVKDINAAGGSNGAATISNIINTVDQVPEPATLALLGVGLSSLAALRRRKISR